MSDMHRKLDALSGKNRALQRVRKSGILYRGAARLLLADRMPQETVNVVPASELQVSSSSPQSSNAVQNQNESPSSSDLDILFQDTQDYEMDLGDSDNSALLDESDEEMSSDTDEDDEPDFARMSNEDCVRYWALAGNESNASIKMILRILRAKTNFNLPTDPIKILRTQRHPMRIHQLGNGKLWYHGIRRCLTVELRKHKTCPQPLLFDLSINRLPLRNRSKRQFWSILLKIVDQPNWPAMVVAIYSGTATPVSSEAFFRPMVDEIKELYVAKLVIDRTRFVVSLRAIIADMAARAFIEAVDSQAGTSPLIDIPNFDFYKDVITVDGLYQVDTGVTIELFDIWFRDVVGKEEAWILPAEILNRLEQQKFPVETKHKLRSFEDLSLWKSTDWQTFLLYASPVVLKGLLTEEKYKHFMLYFCAITILSSKQHKHLWEKANQKLRQFVGTFAKIYGTNAVTSNVHSLTNLYKQAVRFGCIGDYSSYSFVKKLDFLNNYLQSANYRGLEQAGRRIQEFESLNVNYKRQPFSEPVCKGKGQTVTLHVRQGLMLRNDNVNDWLITQENEVFKFVSARNCNGQVKIRGKLFSHIYEVFDSSSEILIFSAKMSELSSEEYELKCSDVKCKLVKVIDDIEEQNFVFFPLLSTLL
uniref:Uncharacterized protein n=1 Tax=Anopheles arabiensis TaxID=7173 RepID=A0A182HP89_ANOAR